MSKITSDLRSIVLAAFGGLSRRGRACRRRRRRQGRDAVPGLDQ